MMKTCLYRMANLILAIEIDKFPPHKVKDEILIPQPSRKVVALYHLPFTNIDLCKAILLKIFVMPIRARARHENRICDYYMLFRYMVNNAFRCVYLLFD